MRIGPDIRMTVVGAPSYFKGRSKPQNPQDLTEHSCINLRLPPTAHSMRGNSGRVAGNSRSAFRAAPRSTPLRKYRTRHSKALGLATFPKIRWKQRLSPVVSFVFSPTGAHLVRAIISITRAAANPRQHSRYLVDSLRHRNQN